MNEFELIARYFSHPATGADLGVGDDAALIRPTPGMQLAVSADMLVSGRHFLPETSPLLLGHKALAVNLSDMAAMGARPRWALLSLALPEADENWLGGFSKGFLDLADRYGVDLVGGDTTRGPLNINVTILGEVTPGQALCRDGARVGDDIWVSGDLGAAALGLKHLRGEVRLPEADAEICLVRLHAPTPRITLGQSLAGLAHAAIDISDGLAGDLAHVLARSSVGAHIELDLLPMPMLEMGRADILYECALSGGDDYELCFTAPNEKRSEVLAAGDRAGVRVTRIGRITEQQGLSLVDGQGAPVAVSSRAYDHFA